jgi:hypothetical protein
MPSLEKKAGRAAQVDAGRAVRSRMREFTESGKSTFAGAGSGL